MLEHIFCTHIRRHLDNQEILGPENHGFWVKHSTEIQLLLTTHDMMKSHDVGNQLDVIILDFSKAFDTIPLRHLLGKLEPYGVKGSLLAWIECFLIGRTQSVLVDGVRSKEEAVMSGVPQGTILRPLLFILYINDLPAQVHSATHFHLFENVCLLYHVTHSAQEQIQLQDDLMNLQQLSCWWYSIPLNVFLWPSTEGQPTYLTSMSLVVLSLNV